MATEGERVGALLADFSERFAAGRSDPGDANVVQRNVMQRIGGPGWAATVVQQSLVESTYHGVGAKAIADEAAGMYRLTTAKGVGAMDPDQGLLRNPAPSDEW